MSIHAKPQRAEPQSAADVVVRWKERYGHEAAPPQARPWNDVLSLLFQHRSIRSFTQEPLPPGTLETLIGAAQSAATSSNLQLWSVLAVEDKARRERLSVLANNQAHIKTAPLLLVFLADLRRAALIARGKGVVPEAVDYLDTFYTASLDAALAAQNAVVAAESLGLGTVYIGALRNNISRVAEELLLPPLVSPVFGLVVGHIDAGIATEVKPRLPQAIALHRETYKAEQDDAALAAYDRVFHAFQDSQGLPRSDWSQIQADRIATKAGLNGRERLRTALEGFGFGLK